MDGPGITVRTIKTGETQLVPDIREDEDFVPGFAKGVYDCLSELVVPVKVGGEAVAVLNVESVRLNAFTDEDRRLLEIFAEHVASAISRLRREEMLRASEERYRTLLEASMDAVLMIVAPAVPLPTVAVIVSVSASPAPRVPTLHRPEPLE